MAGNANNGASDAPKLRVDIPRPRTTFSSRFRPKLRKYEAAIANVKNTSNEPSAKLPADPMKPSP